MMAFGRFTNLDLLAPRITDDLKNTSLDFLEKCKRHLDDDTSKTMVKEGSIAESILEATLELMRILLSWAHTAEGGWRIFYWGA